MTDRIHSLLVVLDHNIREDEVQPLIDALLQMRRVIAVSSNVADFASTVALSRARYELEQKLLGIVYPPKP